MNTQVGSRPSVIIQAGPQENGQPRLVATKASDRIPSESILGELVLNLLQGRKRGFHGVS
jgi:hypothetical protein